jgi:hypothetical protein
MFLLWTISVELCNGGVSACYGDLIGGALLLKARNGRRDRWGGYVDVNMVDGTLLAEGPIGKSFSILTSGRCSYIHKLFDYAYDKFGEKFPAQVTPQYRDFIFRVGGTPKKNQSLYASIGLFHDVLRLQYPDIRGGNQIYENKRDKTNVEVGRNVIIKTAIITKFR